jgi:hypothetical protein
MTNARKINMLKGLRDGLVLAAFLIISPDIIGFAAQQPPAQTPAQIIDQIGGLLKQLQGLLSPATSTPAKTSVELVAALAKCGDVQVGPGTFTGNFVVTPNCPTTVTGSGQGVTILAPADKLSPTLAGYAVRDVVVQDLSVLDGGTFRDTVLFGTIDETDPSKQPQRVTFRRVTVTAQNGGHRGVNFNGSDMTLDDSTVTGFCEKGRDSQAFLAVNGVGPYTITNSTLEASGENILFGGADPGIVGVVPSNIIIRGNRIRKPASYRGACTVKNLVELKTAKGAVVEGNTLDGNWTDGQSGNAIVLTVRNQGGKCPQCIVDDITVRGNTLTNNLDGYAVNILGYDDSAVSQQTQRITIDRNLFADAPGGIQIINGVATALVVTNNTMPKVAGKFLQWDKSSSRPKVLTPLTFSRNVLHAGAYGIMGDGSTGPGMASLLAYATIVEWNGNVIEHDKARTIGYPTTGTGNVLLPAGGLAALLDPKTLKLLSGTAGY